MNLGQSLKYFRKRSNLKQEEVCIKANVGIAHLSQVEKNRKDPSISLLRHLAQIYQVPLPLIWFYALDGKDIPNDNLSAYHFKLLKPTIELLINNCFNFKKENIDT